MTRIVKNRLQPPQVDVPLEGMCSRQICRLRTRQIESEGGFLNGLMQGPWKRWHRNGQVAGEGRLEAGMFEGPWQAWNEDGSVNAQQTGTYHEGVKVEADQAAAGEGAEAGGG